MVAVYRDMWIRSPSSRALAALLLASLLWIPLPASARSRPGEPGGLARTSALRPQVKPSYRSPTLNAPLSPARTRQRLQALCRLVGIHSRRGSRPVVVFDIDDTLVTHSPAQADRPAPGAVAYVNALARAGANIIYLTARKEGDRQRTTSLLQQLHLPLAGAANLLMNDTRLPGDQFKRSAKPRVLAHGRPLAFFDNDLTHVRNYRALYPQSGVFLLNTVSHRKDPGGQGRIDVIDGFAP